ncbi:MAG: hypothetical protein HYU66_16205 [Armatimonadetes bacterium]|nr:hypothetical protein [Armatimonadota bacterium]
MQCNRRLRALSLAAAALVALPLVGCDSSSGGTIDIFQIARVVLRGPTGGVNSVEVTFTGDPNRTQAETISNFVLRGPTGTPIPLGRAHLLASERKVLLEPQAPFAIATNYRSIEIIGTGADAIRDTQGRLLDGDGDGAPGGNALLQYEFLTGAPLQFTDIDGDQVTIECQIAGHLDLLRSTGNQEHEFWIVDGTSNTIVTGGVTRSALGDGSVRISQIIGLDASDVRLLSNPAFIVRGAQVVAR